MCRQEGRHVSPGGLSGWMAQRSGAGRVPDRRQQMWLGKHPLQSRSESARVGGINEQCVFFVFGQFWRGPVVGGDDGQAAVHRFQADDAKPFAWRCQHHQVGAAIGGAQRRTAQLTCDKQRDAVALERNSETGKYQLVWRFTETPPLVWARKYG